MRKQLLIVVFAGLFLCLSLSACTTNQVPDTSPPLPTDPPPPTVPLPPTDLPQSDIEFSSSGKVRLSIPSLNGSQIAIRMAKPEGDGPFPALIGVAGGDGMFVINSELSDSLDELGIVAVDFAPAGKRRE